jgi:tRNA(Ile)-lysidine synthase
LSAVHVHHGLSPNADDWAAFCSQLCQQLKVPLQTHVVSVAKMPGEGLEAAARRARYDIFTSLATDVLLLGHHREDQAETVLFNLLRGSGIRGLAAMPPWRWLDAAPGSSPILLLRPLLETARADMEAWLQQQGLAWIEDESNADGRYSRNFLRHQVMPLLRQRFPVEESLGRAAGLAGEAEGLLEDLAILDLEQVGAGAQLQLPPLRHLSSSRGRNLLRYWLRRAGASMPAEPALADLWQQLLNSSEDGEVAWRLGKWVVHAWRGLAYLVPEISQIPPATPVAWQGEGNLSWGSGQIICRPVQGQGIAARFMGPAAVFQLRQGGERLQLPGRPRRPLKKLLQESALPPWRRCRLPILWIDSRPAWVPGIGIAEDFVASQEEPGWLLEWAEV